MQSGMLIPDPDPQHKEYKYFLAQKSVTKL